MHDNVIWDEEKKCLKCLNCGTKIESVSFDVTATCSASVEKEDIDRDKFQHYDLDSLLSTVEYDNFCCSDCGETIASNWDEVRELLKFVRPLKPKKKQKEITIPLSEEDLERLRDGESFGWEFEGVKVKIRKEEEFIE